MYSIYLFYTHLIYIYILCVDLAGDPLPRGEIRLRLLRVLKTCAPFSAKPTAIRSSGPPILSYRIYARAGSPCALLSFVSPHILLTYLRSTRIRAGMPSPNVTDRKLCSPRMCGILDVLRHYFQASQLESCELHSAASRHSPLFWIRLILSGFWSTHRVTSGRDMFWSRFKFSTT